MRRHTRVQHRKHKSWCGCLIRQHPHTHTHTHAQKVTLADMLDDYHEALKEDKAKRRERNRNLEKYGTEVLSPELQNVDYQVWVCAWVVDGVARQCDACMRTCVCTGVCDLRVRVLECLHLRIRILYVRYALLLSHTHAHLVRDRTRATAPTRTSEQTPTTAATALNTRSRRLCRVCSSTLTAATTCRVRPLRSSL